MMDRLMDVESVMSAERRFGSRLKVEFDEM